jgi:hypothetical protein
MLVRAGLGFLALTRFESGSSLGCFAAEDVEGRKGGGRGGESGGFENRIELTGADYGVDLWDALTNLVAVALD